MSASMKLNVIGDDHKARSQKASAAEKESGCSLWHNETGSHRTLRNENTLEVRSTLPTFTPADELDDDEDNEPFGPIASPLFDVINDD